MSQTNFKLSRSVNSEWLIMRQRGIVFTICLILVALLTTVPMLLLVTVIARDTYNCGGRFNGGLAGIDRTYVPSILNSTTMVQDSFQMAVLHRPNPSQPLMISISSFEIDEKNNASLHFTDQQWHQYEVVGNSTSPNGYTCIVTGDANHLWVIDRSDCVYERVDSQLIQQKSKPADALVPALNWRDQTYCRDFVLGGKLACIVTTASGSREVFQLVENQWRSLGEVELLDLLRNWKNSELQPLFGTSPDLPTASGSVAAINASNSLAKLARRLGKDSIAILPIAGTTYLFWRLEDRLLYRRGMGLIPAIPPLANLNSNASPAKAIASALEPENDDGTTYDWSLVTDNITPETTLFRVAVGGEPAVIVIDESNPQSQIAKVFRQNAGHWSEFAATELPFASRAIEAGSRTDGSMSYLVTATNLGRTRLLAIEPSGIRLTNFDYFQSIRGIGGYIFLAVYLTFSLCLGIVLATIATLLMWRDQAQHGFGVQFVELASVWERGAARIIDLSLIALTTTVTFVVLNELWKPDWLTFIEAIQHTPPILDHPAIMAPTLIGMACLFVLIISIAAIVILQGKLSITPGKWIFGLRTVRTTLRPCGIAQSLLREILMCVDCLDLISWTPGILCIAFTQKRQRSGDLAADTVVIRARSLATSPKGLMGNQIRLEREIVSKPGLSAIRATSD